MRRRILIAVLALGTVLGFGAGFASLRWRGACGHHGHHGRYGSAAFEQRVSELCADAALRARGGSAAPEAPTGRR